MASEEVTEESAQGSPRNRLKFVCSYGGKILPRPSDGNLKYVGGETRVVALPRHISFSELMKKLSGFVHGEMVLKYQIIPGDLDALVSVKSDEDLKHMIDEHDRHESQGIPKLRAFLFPPNPVVLENQVPPVDPRTIEQRYIDAINGVFHTHISSKLHPIIAHHPSFSVSACSSPKSNSPEENNLDLVPTEPSFSNSYQTSRLSIQRVRSSPSICSLNSQPHQNTNLHHHTQNQHYYQNHLQCQHHGYGSFRPSPPSDLRKGVWNESASQGSLLWRGTQSHGQNQYLPTSRHDSGGGFYEDGSGYGSGTIDRVGRVPISPRKLGVRP